MIGKEVRSFKQLARVVDDSVLSVFFTFDHQGDIKYGKCVVVDNGKEKNLLIFNNSVGDKTNNGRIFLRYEKWNGAEKINALSSEFCCALGVDVLHVGGISTLMRSIVVLPQSFEKDYSTFCESNKKFFQKYSELLPREILSKYMYCITNGSKNFFNWAIDLYYREATPQSLIRLIMCWNDKYGQMAKELSKGTITAYTSRKGAYSSYNEMRHLRDKKRANDAMNFFNTAQKKLLKSITLSQEETKMLSQFERLSAVKKKNFVRKMSTIDDVKEILHNVSLLVGTKFRWNKNAVLEFISNSELMECEIVIDKGDILLVKAKNYEAIKQLGRFTSWCISKNKHYWDEYVGSKDNTATQYVLFDFSKKEDDKLSIVGFTSLFNRGITNAHNLNNENLMGSRQQESKFERFIPRKIKNNIYNILDCHHINVDDVTEYEPLPFKWNKEGFIGYLKKFVSNFSILAETETSIVISVIDNGIADFFGEKYFNYFSNGYKYEKHIIFADFSLPVRRLDKILFSVILRNHETAEDNASTLYDYALQTHDISFDSQIVKYGIPYDIISRDDDITMRLKNAISSYDIDVLNSILSDSKIRDGIKNNNIKIDSNSNLYCSIESSLFGDYTFSLVDAFYNNGITLCELIGFENTERLLRHAFNNIHRFSNGSMRLSAETIQRVENGNSSNVQLSLFVQYTVFSHIIERENNIKLFKEINPSLDSYSPNQLYDKIVKIEANIMKNEHFDYSRMPSNITNVFRYGIKNNIQEIITIVCFEKSAQDKLAREGVNIPIIINS